MCGPITQADQSCRGKNGCKGTCDSAENSVVQPVTALGIQPTKPEQSPERSAPGSIAQPVVIHRQRAEGEEV